MTTDGCCACHCAGGQVCHYHAYPTRGVRLWWRIFGEPEEAQRARAILRREESTKGEHS